MPLHLPARDRLLDLLAGGFPGPLAIEKQRRAEDATAAVLPFAYEPSDPKEAKKVSAADLDRWQQLLARGLDTTNVLAQVVTAEAGAIPPGTRYLISGRITKFNFQKNWIPTFFPLHIAASVFTSTLYTWLAGPTTVTDVDFEVSVDVRHAASGDLVTTAEGRFHDMSVLHIYSPGTNNPYNNPNLVFSQVVESLAVKIAAALPAEPPVVSGEPVGQ